MEKYFSHSIPFSLPTSCEMCKYILYSTSLKGVDFEERRCRFLHLWTQHYLVIFPSCENSIHFENLRNLMAIINFELRYGRLKYSHLEYLNSR